MNRVDGYLPIAEYGAIGDCRSMALVGSDGSIDWCCLPRFDSGSVFGRILDARKGGFWQIEPVGPYTSRQQYLDKTNILRTTFFTDGGVASLVDFMPADEADVRQHAHPHRHPRVVRLVTGLAGEVTLRNAVHGAPDYGRGRRLRAEGGRVHGDSGDHHFCVSATFPLRAAEQEITVGAGESVALALACNSAGHCGTPLRGPEAALKLMRSTQDYWWRWVTQCSYTGPYQDRVWRSALALKLMTYAPTGAIVAAPTTSLPEWIGGSRNWDYRFTWLRDASFTLYALFQLGFRQEAADFMEWLCHLTLERGLHNLYPLDGHRHVGEATLDHLEGYRGSGPVRIGNAAADQLQLDVYGELLDAAWVHHRNGGQITPGLWRALTAVIEYAAGNWWRDDASIWEVRGLNLPFTYSRVMCWVALDRGARLAEALELPAPVARWRSTAEEIHAAVLRHGWSKRKRAFTQAFSRDAVDATALRLVQLGFLPDDDPRLRSTIRAVDRELSIPPARTPAAGGGGGALLRRYLPEETDDGLDSDEGAFMICGFWMADALAIIGDVEAAERRFERLLAFGTPLGLFSEEVDARGGGLLGNFPQAFSHLALISAAVNIERRRQGTMRRGPRS